MSAEWKPEPNRSPHEMISWPGVLRHSERKVDCAGQHIRHIEIGPLETRENPWTRLKFGKSHVPPGKITHLFEYRDDDGFLRGVLVFYTWGGEIGVIVDPEYRRKGIASRLLAEAATACPQIIRVLRKQAYTPAGAGLVRKFFKASNGRS